VLVVVTARAERHDVAQVELSSAKIKRNYVMNLETIGRAARRAAVAVALLRQLSPAGRPVVSGLT
jgi:hypothetical protein